MSVAGTRQAKEASEKFEKLRRVSHCAHCGNILVKSPSLTCVDCGKRHRLRCFFYRYKDLGYVAECIDLNLVCQGRTPDEAVGALQEAMVGYLLVAFDGPTAGLVLRHSPFVSRVRYYFHRIAHRMRERLTLRHNKHLALSDSVGDDIMISHC